NNVKGPGFRVAADNTGDAMFILSAGIDGGGVDGVAGRDPEDGLVERGELTIEGRRCELVALRRLMFEWRRGVRRECPVGGMVRIGRVGFFKEAGERAAC